MEYEKNFRKKFICANCGKIGHEFRSCNEPITSFGIINIKILDDINESLLLKDKFSTKKNTYYRIVSKKYPDIKCYISDNIKLYDNNLYKLDNETIPYSEEEHLLKFNYYKNKILFMMVSRKFSLGFIEFIRGKYSVDDTKGIINLFEQMYDDEIKYIHRNQYDNILYYFLNRNNEPKEVVLNRIYESRYSNEYCEAKIKFNMLLNTSDDDNNNVPWNLHFYTKNIKPKWKKPEWGFPKGRRDKHTEENLSCACREFEEETGYKKSEYFVLNKIEPIEERLVGTNGVSYKHIYYLSINNSNKDFSTADYDIYEIGEIKWFTYDEAMNYIRPYHVEKKKILTRVYLFILNYLIHNVYDI
ncbi:MAG: NUDIX hydrolase [Satyrvirus sp.]|uniref:NUDIX hydrolase n=1 Tax=Satyrvirus sp. TaxID=2487771 RepID=A0A3G5ADZ0_9VIRU|nr:MAG: NUDIX hydrolase [Satyrvirus sp.]